MRLAFLVFLCFSTINGFAQHRLVLLKQDNVIVSFHEGDYIRFKRKDRDHFTKGFIAGVHPDYFRIGEDTTYTHQLQKIDLTGLPNSGFKTSGIGSALIVAGLVLFVSDWINTTVVQDEEYTAHKGVIVSSALMVGAGVFMKFFNNDNFVLGRKKKAVILDW
jgi:hypothetical protein